MVIIMRSNTKQSTPVVIIPLQGTEEISPKIIHHLQEMLAEDSCRVVNCDIVHFTTGDAKAVLLDTVRGADVYIIVDVGNYGCSFRMFDREVTVSPDEHFQNLKRTISAIGGKAASITVISPLLYSSRQDRRIARESLDCAVALRELESIKVNNVLAFDVHDNRVQNAIPFTGFDDLYPIYQVLKAINKCYPDIVYKEENAIFVSPDFGATDRNYKYTNELGLDMGIFYKRRSRDKMENGSYVVEAHKYIGPEVSGKDVFIVDDILGSGKTMLDVVYKMNEMNAKRVFLVCTFAVFSSGMEIFNEAYEKGLFTALFITNASYRRPEIKNSPWYREVDITKYIAYYIYCINQGESIAKIMDPHKKIAQMLRKREQKD